MEDKEWRERFENTKTIAEAKQVMEQFCKKEGFESKRINPHPQFSAVKAI